MDPLSLTASIIAVVGAATTVAKQLDHLRATLRDTPDDLCSVVNEISDLQLVLETCKAVTEHLATSDIDRSAPTAEINVFLCKSEQYLQELGQLVSSCLSPSSSGGGIQRVRIARFRWSKASSQVNKLRTKLRDSRQDIHTLWEANNCLAISEMRLCLQGISLGAQRFQVDTSKRLDDVLAKLNNQAIRTEQLTIRNNNTHNRVGRARNSAVKEIASPDLLMNDTAEPHLLGNKAQPISIFALGYRKTCRLWCSCCCHIKRSIRSPSSGILQTLVGSLFVGYSGIPAITPPCNETQCRRRSSMRIMLSYQFPEWFWTNVLFASCDTTTLAGPELLLRVQTKIPFNSAAIDYCFRGDIMSLKRMFENGTASPFDVNPDGTSLFCYALKCSNYKLCHFLISCGADIHQEDCIGQSAFSFALDRILYEPANPASQALLELLPQEEDSLDDRQFSRIHKCVLGLTGSDLVSELTISTSSINDVDGFGRTPLWWAARRGDSDAVLTLLHFNADPNARGHQRVPTGIMPTLPLHAAAASGNASVVHHLISHTCVDVNQRGVGGWTPLHYAVSQNDGNEYIEMLIRAGANVNARSGQGWDALFLTLSASYFENAKVLLKYGADIDGVDDAGWTALAKCIVFARHDSVLWLLHTGARYDFTIEGSTLLHLAASHADLSVLQILCDADLRGLEVDAENNAGRTAKEVADTRVEQLQEWHDTFQKFLLMAGRKETITVDGNDVYEDGSLILGEREDLRVNDEVSVNDSDGDEVFYDAKEKPNFS
ncbi:MAG: hypothetical protein Q9157_005414 [Trypethelium eluteriae]